MEFFIEPERKTEVCYDTDICVIGGSCTGVFAAVRAARLGARVAIIEKHNCFGGVATSGLVCVWHQLHNFDKTSEIIGGLTAEVVKRLKRTGSVLESDDRNSSFRFNTQELKIELDELVKENKIKPYLHTFYVSSIFENDEIKGVIIENKDGRKAIKAKFFIDASGDGDMARDLKLASYYSTSTQPPTSCFLMSGHIEYDEFNKIYQENATEFGLADDWGWSVPYIAHKDISMRADGHVFGLMCNKADHLSQAEIEGRRQMRAFISLLNKYGSKDENYKLIAACSEIGIRETAHFETGFKATEMSLLMGEGYEDAVLNGTYRVDIHHGNDNGITLKELNGEASVHFGKGRGMKVYNWREKLGITADYPQFYQVPFRILVDKKYKNFIPVGRMINADEGAFGALRVMVNLNQLGEAAGVAAYYSVNNNIALQNIDGKEVKALLNKGGSLIN